MRHQVANATYPALLVVYDLRAEEVAQEDQGGLPFLVVRTEGA
jgi:hypothetical protein